MSKQDEIAIAVARRGPGRRVRREPDGTWAANVWVPGMRRRNHYRTRREAQEASIADENILYTSPYLLRGTRR